MRDSSNKSFLTENISLPDNNSYRSHCFELSIVLHFCFHLQHGVHIMFRTSKYRQDNPRCDVVSSLLLDHFAVSGPCAVAAIPN